MLIYPCTKCMNCCWDPTTQSNELGPIWYLQPKLGFRRNSFMSLWPWHVPLAWHMSCGVISSNSPATMLWDITFQSKLTKTSPTCKITLLIDRIFKFPVKLGNKKLTGPLSWSLENCLPLDTSATSACPKPQRPQPRLLQLALLLQEHGQVVHGGERVGVLGSQLGLAAFQGSAVQPFCLAARDGALRWWNMRREPGLRPHGSWKGKKKPTKATIFGL